MWLFILQPLIPSFPEIFLGQVSLTRETKSLPPNKYLSAEFVLGQVDPSDILHAVYIDLEKDVLFWDPYYVGFPRTELSVEEMRQLQTLFSSGNLFDRAPKGDGYQCVDTPVAGGPMLRACPQGEKFMDQFSSALWEADQTDSVGVLKFYLSRGRLAEIRVYPTPSGLAFEPYEKTGDWWLKGIAPPSPLLETLADRASVHPIEILWPWMSASMANDRAARVLGDQYWKALEFVEESSAMVRVFGDIQDIRPAVGLNTYASWMDSTSLFLTLRVIGSRGEGAVIVQGYDCLDLRMVFRGVPIEDGEYDVCP
jgi:hypothetical protein